MFSKISLYFANVHIFTCHRNSSAVHEIHEKYETHTSNRSPSVPDVSHAGGRNKSSNLRIRAYPFLNNGIVHVKNNMEK